MAKLDSIIIGAGHNGLVCATYLAKSGQNVLLVEAGQAVGGMAAPVEFQAGYHAPLAHSADHFPRSLARDLDLKSHGLKFSRKSRPRIGLSAQGQHVFISDGKIKGVGEADGDAYKRYRKQLGRFADALAPFWLKSIPRIAPAPLGELMTFGKIGFNLRRLGKKDMRELLRVFTLPMRDLMDENFESEPLKAMLSWDGLVGSRMAPRSPNNALLALLYRQSGNRVVGGSQALMSALESAARAHGADIRTGARVEKISLHGDTSGLKATGVTLTNGETLVADHVISSVDPQNTFLNLVGAPNLEIGFSNRIKRLRCNGLVARLHLALSGPPVFGGIEDLGGRMFIAPKLDAIEFAFDDAKYGELPEHPVMEVTLPSVQDPTLAPAGAHLLAADVMYVPRELKGGWTAEARQQLQDRLLDTLEQYAPGIRSLVMGHELLTPGDIEKRYGVTGGHWHHTELALDQMLMMRPTYEAAQYRTPIPGLWLCGAGSHPGGDLTGAAGHNAAQALLKALKS